MINMVSHVVWFAFCERKGKGPLSKALSMIELQREDTCAALLGREERRGKFSIFYDFFFFKKLI